MYMYIYIYIYICVYIHTHTRMCIYIYIYTHTYIHTYVRTYIHTYMQTQIASATWRRLETCATVGLFAPGACSLRRRRVRKTEQASVGILPRQGAKAAMGPKELTTLELPGTYVISFEQTH